MDPNLRLPGLDISPYENQPAPLYLPRSAGGAVPRAAPNRSRSPPQSPTNMRPSPRPVQSAPSRLDPLSVASLHNPSALPIAMRTQPRTEGAGKLLTGVTGHLSQAKLQQLQKMQRNVGSPDIGLSIRSAATPPEGMAQRPQMRHTICQGSLRTKPNLIGSKSAPGLGGFGNAKMLPPLECRGQARAEGSRSPSPDDVEARASKLRGIRTGSPVRASKQDAERLKKSLLLQASKDDMNDPILTIGSLRKSGGTAPPSGLLPPEMRNDVRVAAAKIATTRPATHMGTSATTKQQGGMLSMPQLGPPRLLVQSVGAAH